MSKKVILGGVVAIVLIAAMSLMIRKKGGDYEAKQKLQQAQQPTEQQVPEQAQEGVQKHVQEPNWGQKEQGVAEPLETAGEISKGEHIANIRRSREAMRSDEDAVDRELLDVWLEKLEQARKDGDRGKIDELIKKIQEDRQQRLQEAREIHLKRREELRKRFGARTEQAEETDADPGEQK